jgi:hypothetical protein
MGCTCFLDITRFSSQFIFQWATCSVFLMVIAFAMAELGSSAPTSGVSVFGSGYEESLMISRWGLLLDLQVLIPEIPKSDVLDGGVFVYPYLHRGNGRGWLGLRYTD